MAGLNSNAKAATQLLASQVVLNEAAKRTGMDITAGQAAQGDHRRDAVVDGQDDDVRGQHRRDQRHRHRQASAPAAAANALAAVLLERIERRRRREDRPARGAARDRRRRSCSRRPARSVAAQTPPWRRSPTAAARPRRGRRPSAPYIADRPGGRHRAGGAGRVSIQKTELHAAHRQAGRSSHASCTRPPPRTRPAAPASRSTSPPARSPASSSASSSPSCAARLGRPPRRGGRTRLTRPPRRQTPAAPSRS